MKDFRTIYKKKIKTMECRIRKTKAKILVKTKRLRLLAIVNIQKLK